VQQFDWRDATRPGKTLLCVDQGGTLVWSGIMWTRTYRKTQAGKLPLGASELTSYLGRRLQAENYESTWLAGETATGIVQRVIDDALTAGSFGGGLALSVVVHEEYEPPKVTAQYPSASLQTIESIMSTLSQMGYGAGFDYSIDAQYRSGTKEPELVINLWFPRMGRTYAENGIVLMDKDCLDWEYPENGTSQAWVVTETGSGTGGIVPATTNAELGGEYPLLERTASHTQVISEETLVKIGFGDCQQTCYPVVTPWIELDALAGPLTLGEFALGDDVLWRVDPVAGAGNNTNPRFPDGMVFEWRIVGWTCTPSDAGVSKLLLDLALPPISSIPPPAPPR
jgi:hypothetical protein